MGSYSDSRDKVLLFGAQVLATVVDPLPLSKDIDTSQIKRKNEYHFIIEAVGEGPFPPSFYDGGNINRDLLIHPGDRILVSGSCVPVVLDCKEYFVIQADSIKGVVRVADKNDTVSKKQVLLESR